MPAATGPIDQPLGITLLGQAPGSVVRIQATAAFLGRTWTASARYRVGPSGSIDLARVPPLSGSSYTGAHGMGLFWSLASTSAASASVADVAAPERVSLSVTGPGRRGVIHLTRVVSDPARVSDLTLRPGRGRGPARAAGLYADYVFPSGAHRRPGPGVVIIGGSEGGLATGLPVAEALASHGVATLDLAYFGEPGLPQHLDLIPIEYFAAALHWLASRPQVDPHRLFLYGVSRGTEAALLTASYFPSLVSGVVAMVPSDSVLCGAPACATSGWTYQGRALPFTRQVSNPRPTDVPGALIPVGRITGRVLLVCAGHDQHWASCPYAGTIATELTAAGRAAPVLLDYPAAGHGVGFALPYLPRLDSPGLEGSSVQANPLARADEWPKILAFLGASG